MKLLLKRGLYIPSEDKVVEPGQEIEVNDEARVAELLENGTAVKAEDAEAAEETKLPEGDVVDQLSVDGHVYTKLVNVEGTFYTLDDEVIPESAFDSAKQALVQSQLEAQNVPTGFPEHTEVTTPADPLAPQQPTPEQVQQTLQSIEQGNGSQEPQNTQLS